MQLDVFLSSITLALMGMITFTYIANKIPFNFPYQLKPYEKYAGALPVFGALVGIIGGFYLNKAFMPNAQLDYKILIIVVLFAGIGFLRDKYRFSKFSVLVISLICAILSIYFYFPGITYPKMIGYTFFIIILLVCLKISSLVYEMPFILISTSAITHMLFMFNSSSYNIILTLIDLALATYSVATIIHSCSGYRILISNSGILASGIALALVSLVEPTGNLLLFSFFIPAMAILYPIAFISLMIVTSYFGNKLHKTDNEDKHGWRWSLNREKTINFSALIFLCLNFTGLLVILKAPVFGYICLLALLILSMTSFIKTFARKLTVQDEKNIKIDILGNKIDAIMPKDVLNKINEHIADPDSGFMHIITADSLALVRTQNDPEFQKIMDNAEMVVPDGAGIVWAADFIGTPLPSRVPGVALVSQICELSDEKNHKLFLIGSKPGIAEKAAETLKEKYNANIVGVEHGYFAKDSEDEEKMLQKIQDSKADIVFVALGVPRQEDFITKLRKYAKHIVAIGVGGSFDVISGTLPRAPQWMQRFGMEWLFRLCLEPKRIVRIMEIPLFVINVMRYKLNQD
ncbi:MAG: WecB/TagA/CpsF family glycosyltransferase [Candidatus Riflebacteria bacterium]|nr:WecB/TagA/CpsF family glycosyltransferase [Candidatus Riflebacteria bacterium]